MANPALPCHVKHSGRFAVLVAQAFAAQCVTFDDGIMARLCLLRKQQHVSLTLMIAFFVIGRHSVP